MTILLTEILGSPHIGIFGFSNEKIAILPKGIAPSKIEEFTRCLGVKVLESYLAGSRLLGIFIAANSNGMVLPYISYEHEVKAIKSATDIIVDVIHDKNTALGNMILTNDYGAIISPIIPHKTLRRVSDILGVEAVRGRISGLPYVGAMAVATNKGVFAHQSIQEEEEKLIREVLRVEVTTGTVNNGTPLIKSGLIANNKGAIAGSLTVGNELMGITRAIKV